MLTDMQTTFCRHFVANGGNGTQAAREAGYSDAAPAASKMLKTRWIRQEIERLHLAASKATNEMLANAVSGSQGSGRGKPTVDPDLANSLAVRRGADDEVRAVVSMAYIIAGLIEGYEMAMGRRPQLQSR